jgi:hypothetical protein
MTETTRGAEAPPELVACSIFIIGFGLLVFVECPRHEVSLRDPPNREPRANGLLWSLCCSDQSIQPVQAPVLRQFYCSRPGRGASPNYNASPKESVSCASRRLVFIVRESIRLIFIVLCIACYCSCTKAIAGRVPTFGRPSETGGSMVIAVFSRRKKAGVSLP